MCIQWHLPHIYKILSYSNRVWVTADSDCSVGVAAFSLLTVRYANHSTRNLTDLGDFRATLANDAANQVIWHGHFVLLPISLLLTTILIG